MWEADFQAATSPPLYLGTSILAARNAALAIQLTTPAQPNVSATGTYRNPTSGTLLSSDHSSESETIRKMMHAGERTSGSTFQPRWNVLRAKEEYEKKRAAGEALQAAQAQAAVLHAQNQAAVGMRHDLIQQNGGQMQGQGGGVVGGAGGAGGAGAGGGENKPKKPKKKRAAPAAEGAAEGGASAPSKPKKKKTDGEKKKAAGGGGGAGNKKKAAGGGGNAPIVAKTE